MAIIGESFEPWVKDQVNIRQEKLALRDKDNNIIKYITNKTSFLRLTSGVDIVNDNAGLNKLKAMGLNIPNDFIGPSLAKDYVLFSANFGGEFTANIGYDRLGSSHGFTSNPDYGLTPPPGIISANIKSLNRGSLREATINVVCHNLLQFKIISALFLKLRYSLLLEWGHTLYFKKDGSLATEFDIPNLSNDFLNKTVSTQEDLLKKIESERKKSDGNYDAFFGVIKNFNWELQENGSYNVTINAISTGDVIESLKINTNISPNETAAPIVGDTPSATIYSKSSLHKILGFIRQKIEENNGYLHGIKLEPYLPALDTDSVASITGLKANYKNSEDNQTVKSPNGILSWGEGKKVNFDFSTDNDKEAVSPSPQYYVKLGTLLRIIESFLLYYDTSKSKTPPVFFIDHNFDTNECFTIPKQIPLDPRVCLIPVDTSRIFDDKDTSSTGFLKKTTTYIFGTTGGTVGGFWYSRVLSTESSTPVAELPEGVSIGDSLILSAQYEKGGNLFFSVDNNGLIKNGEDVISSIRRIIGFPLNADEVGGELGLQSVTVVVDTYAEDTRVETLISKAGEGRLQFLDKGFLTDNLFIGKTMNIYLNIDYIMSVLDNNIDEDGKVSLFDFLTNLMNGVKKSLGYINDFEVIYKENINTYYIIDNALTPLKYENLDKKNIAKFNINLLKNQNNGGGSFVTNFGLKSELFSKIANTIALGAQANGNTLISNSTAFSEFNAGLIDRFLEVKQNLNVEPSSGVDKYQIAYNNYIAYLYKLLGLEPSTATIFTIAGGVWISYSDPKFNDEVISAFESYITDVLQFNIGVYTNNKNIPGTGFIPLNLQLTMDGLSGMKIYETFDIDETLLPDEYQSRIRFIIRGVSHKIDNKGWETNIETLSVPKLAGAANKDIKFPKITSGGGFKAKSSPPPDITPITIDPSRNLYNEAIKYKDYVYQLGAKGERVTVNRGTNKGKSFNAIDCSGFVNKVLGTSQLNSESTTARGINFRQVSKLDSSNLKEGDVIGIDKGDYDYDRGRAYGIDHILIVIKNLNTGKLEIWESNGPSVSKYNSEEKNSYGGVRSTLIDSKVKSLNEESRKIFISSYLA
jgi:hypothetical protein